MSSAPALHWPLAALRQQLHALMPGLGVEVHAQLDSTSSELMRRARDGLHAPALLVAEAQTAGRGRMGRHWQSGARAAAGEALTFSLGLPLKPRDWSGLSLAVGLAVAESLHPDVRIKWPNDLWWQGRKLAGILVETAGAGRPGDARYAVIGVGLNITALPADGLRTPPAWLQELLPDADAPAALLRVAAVLVQAVRAFEHSGFAPLAPRFAARDALAGQAVRLSDGSEGTACGVGADGALRLRTAQGQVLPVLSSEVSVRPVRAQEG